MNPNALPIELRHHEQWVCWASRERNGKQTKIPIDPSTGGFASTADPNTWSTFDGVLSHLRSPDVTGIGFVFTSEDPYVGVDLDDCRDADTGKLTEQAVSIVKRLSSYTEISPSGTGLHVLVRGALPDGQRRRGTVEMYSEGRFFTMTGNRLVGTPQRVRVREAALRDVHRTYVAPEESESPRSTSERVPPARELEFTTGLDDETLLEKAASATNGEKFSALWNGNAAGYDSQSEADMALCCLLAFWTGGESKQIDRLFRHSGLIREKWDEVHSSDGATYGERTVQRAIETTDEFYEGRRE